MDSSLVAEKADGAEGEGGTAAAGGIAVLTNLAPCFGPAGVLLALFCVNSPWAAVGFIPDGGGMAFFFEKTGQNDVIGPSGEAPW